MRTVILLLVLGLFALIFSLQGEGEYSLRANRQLVVGFGDLREGEQLNRKFRVISRDDIEETVIGVIPGCGCTSATVEDKTIPAGGSTELSVVIDTKGRSGKQTFRVDVLFADGKVGSLVMVGNVKPKS